MTHHNSKVLESRSCYSIDRVLLYLGECTVQKYTICADGVTRGMIMGSYNQRGFVRLFLTFSLVKLDKKCFFYSINAFLDSRSIKKWGLLFINVN